MEQSEIVDTLETYQVQASKSDLVAMGVAIDLLQMAERVGPQYEASEHENLCGEEGFSLDSITIGD